MSNKKMKVTVNDVPVSLVAAINYRARQTGITRNKLLLELFQYTFGDLEKGLEAAANAGRFEREAPPSVPPHVE